MSDIVLPPTKAGDYIFMACEGDKVAPSGWTKVQQPLWLRVACTILFVPKRSLFYKVVTK